MKNPPKVNDPIRFIVTPERIGRHRDVDPFPVALGTHAKSTEKMVAARILKHARIYLMKPDVPVEVDLNRGTWKISGGRAGHGRIEISE